MFPVFIFGGVLCQQSDLHTFSVSYCSLTVVIEKKRITCYECCKLFSTLGHLYIMYWLCVFSPQSAALQKKLHHLEGQLNNEKQVKDELEHKYRYWGFRSTSYSCLCLL